MGHNGFELLEFGEQVARTIEQEVSTLWVLSDASAMWGVERSIWPGEPMNQTERKRMIYFGVVQHDGIKNNKLNHIKKHVFKKNQPP